MAGDRYVVLGLATARAPWFRAVAQWANAASIPVEFVKCVSAEELRARLSSARPFSAVIVDGRVPAVDRDLLDAARAAGCAALVVDDDVARARSWAAIGAHAVLAGDLDRKSLLDALAAHARPIGRGDLLPGDGSDVAVSAWRGRVATVCGPGGTGTSTVAIALAQAQADDVRNGGMVLLADLARHGEQAMLHDAGDVVPGVQEVVEAHRSGRPSVDDLRRLTFHVEARGYHLLLGLRRSRAWASLRPRAFAAAFDTLRRAHRVVVCDTDADLEGEADGGSADVEERNVMARTAVAHADAVFAVGLPGLKGTHSLVRVLADLLAFGVPAERIVPVVNRAPRGPRPRAELTATIASLLPAGTPIASPVFLPERKVDDVLRDGVRLPPQLCEPLGRAFDALVERVGARSAGDEAVPERVVPGSLGAWTTDESHEAAAG